MAAVFHDVRFPLAIGFGATGGPERRIEIVALTSGREQRNLRQAHALRRYDAGTGLRSLADIEEILRFYEARLGPLHPFRFRDPFDWKSCALAQAPAAQDQNLGSGDGTRAEFALVKTYGVIPHIYARPISCAVAASVQVAVNGTVKPASTYTVTGFGAAIRFNAGHIPANGQTVTAGFEFDVPVRFDTQALTLSLTGFKAGQVQAIPLKEVIL
jgi:uncharacterized protein (TIGR02217 family)